VAPTETKFSRAAIETTYRGARFRSRLEARWAAFFDLLGWRWEYEPIDLDGYIPDFILLIPAPVLVEVKPGWSCEELERAAAGKIDSSGWRDDALIVGASWSTPGRPRAFFTTSATLGPYSNEYLGWTDSVWASCRRCSAATFTTIECYRICSQSGCENDSRYPVAADHGQLEHLWNEAGSAVRWKR